MQHIHNYYLLSYIFFPSDEENHFSKNSAHFWNNTAAFSRIYQPRENCIFHKCLDMDILEKAMQAFSKVHCTHLTLYHKASLTNDPNKAKSIVELSQLPSDFCSLLTAEFGLNNCQKKKKRKTVIQTCADNWPWNSLTSSPFFLFVFYLPWEACESCSPLCTHPDSKAPCPSAPSCLLTARLSRMNPWAYVERCVSYLEASYTEQMGSAWDEETNLMSWL